MTDSNRRPPPCKGGALPTELITLFNDIYSFIVKVRKLESIFFFKRVFVCCKFNRYDEISIYNLTFIKLIYKIQKNIYKIYE
jgi:hypothetical protein